MPVEIPCVISNSVSLDVRLKALTLPPPAPTATCFPQDDANIERDMELDCNPDSESEIQAMLDGEDVDRRPLAPSPSSPALQPRPSRQNLHQPSVTTYFSRMTREEWLEHTKHKLSHPQEENTDRKEMERLKKERKDEKRRLDQRQRQEKCRRQKREKERDEGKRDDNLKVIKKPRFEEYEVEFNHAEASRSQVLAEEQQVTRRSAKEGGPAKQRFEQPHRVNWQSPTYWNTIEEVAKQVPWPYNNTEIVRRLQRHGGDTYAKLSPSLLGTWIDRVKTSQATGVVWKEEVLGRAAAGNGRTSGHAV